MNDMSFDEFLEHYGVKGMRWGVRRSEAQLQRDREKKVKKEVKTLLKTEKRFGKINYEQGESEASQRIARSRRENDSRRAANRAAKKTKGTLDDADAAKSNRAKARNDAAFKKHMAKIQEEIDSMPAQQKSSIQQRVDRKGIKKLSDTELQERITRLEKERKLGDLQKTEGQKMAEDIMKGIGSKTLKTVGTGVAIYGGKLVVNALLGEKAASFVPKPKK